MCVELYENPDGLRAIQISCVWLKFRSAQLSRRNLCTGDPVKTISICCCVVLAIVSFSVAQDSASQSQKLAAGEHTADVAGIHIWYRVAGKGPLIVVQAPGWGAGSQYLQNGIAQLENDFTVIYYDPRGSARSSRPGDSKRMATDDMIDDLEALRAYWGLPSITVLGHSNGGGIALGYAIQHPEITVASGAR